MFSALNMKKISIIITAGGIGKRMGAALPKQFLLLAGEPILMRTLQQMHRFIPNAQLIITLPESWIEEWKQLCQQYDCSIAHEVVSGGKERFHSVKNALEICSGDYILVHDGVRPLVSQETVQRGVASLDRNKASLPIVDVVESIREVKGGKSKALDRSNYKLVQTPQFFWCDEIKAAYNLPFSPDFTDDASVLERAGVDINLFEGNTENVKITQLSDLELAEFLWKNAKA